MRRASLNTSVLSPILQCSSLLSSAQSSHQRIYNNAEIFNIPLTVVWFDKDCVSINNLLIQWSQLQAQSSFNLQGNASSFKHSHQFLGKEYTSEKWNITCNIYFLQASAVISVSASNAYLLWQPLIIHVLYNEYTQHYSCIWIYLQNFNTKFSTYIDHKPRSNQMHALISGSYNFLMNALHVQELW